MHRTLRFRLLPIISLALILQGCAVFLIGTGVLGGIAISEDTVQSEVEGNFKKVWAVTLDELERMGQVKMKDEGGRIEAKVKGSDVVATIEQATDKVVRLKVKARKRLLPHVKLAHEIVGRVLKRL